MRCIQTYSHAYVTVYSERVVFTQALHSLPGAGGHMHENTVVREYATCWIRLNTSKLWMHTTCEYAWMHSVNTLWIHASLNTPKPALHIHMNATRTWMHPSLYTLNAAISALNACKALGYTRMRLQINPTVFVNKPHHIPVPGGVTTTPLIRSSRM